MAYLLPVLLFAALALTYVVDRRFYLRHVLRESHREFQVVEILTVFLAFSASFLLVIAGRRAWCMGTADRLAGRVTFKPGFKGILDGRGGAAIIFVLAAGAFFFAGEEISWGQTYLGWESELRETNLHNTIPISFSGLGSIVIIVLLIGIPIVWKLRDRLPVPADWEPAVAEWPVVTGALIAFGVSWVKDIAAFVIGDVETSRVYIDYFEQLNEQKEMLMALAMLIYSLYRIKATRPSRSADGTF